ncbi:YybH family protein [Arenimonas fontis]|uniref:Nuclear transport factor 2 family protein n=1 Tax=Arenimonas fontis TaxID=2608255 RepID=A0A5B2ZE54_9GAMM|nr:nuclear transport factor 2 family protein [Arenimonas fontis]KAA2286289.1 nuclear transport factor 2 family protein [Arenimonas fontis]
MSGIRPKPARPDDLALLRPGLEHCLVMREDAVFVNGRSPLRGREAITAHWRRFYEAPDAPFSWRPETVVVLSSGELAQTKGPVFDPEGKTIGEFRSTWRRNADGSWQVVFDDGACLCGTRQQ